MEVYNFAAGPARLPKEVMKQAQEEFCCYQDSGSGILELSHRGKYFAPVIERAEANIRELMGISDDYAVCFIQGGGSMQFASNTFVAPGAYGNYCLYDGQFETTPNHTTAVSLEIGVGVFGHSQPDSVYFLRRLAMDLERVKAPLRRRTSLIPFKAFVDSYSAEVAWY